MQNNLPVHRVTPKRRQKILAAFSYRASVSALAAIAAGFRLRLGGGVALRHPFQPSLHLLSTVSALRPQTEAWLDFIHLEVMRTNQTDAMVVRSRERICPTAS
jgi:hypothetical protein